MTYLMSDIHGEYNMFLHMLENINFSEDDTLYILGDVVDRGPEPIKLLQYIMQQDNIVLLRGNHEQMMLDALYFVKDKNEFISTVDSRLWMNNGGFVTVDQFLELSIDEQLKIYNFLKETEWFKIVGKNVLVHAGLPTHKFDFKTDEEIIKYMKQFNKDCFIWDRDFVWNDDFYLDNYHVYCGHTPTLKLHPSNRVYETKGFTLIDGGACFAPGTLICICLETGNVCYQERNF